MTVRPCLECGTPTAGTRCPAHALPAKQPRPDLRTAAWARTRKRIIGAWLETRGLACPGWGVAAHPVPHPSELTVDHVNEVARGGSTEGPYQVLCRSCNGRKGAEARDGLPPSGIGSRTSPHRVSAGRGGRGEGA